MGLRHHASYQGSREKGRKPPQATRSDSIRATKAVSKAGISQKGVVQCSYYLFWFLGGVRLKPPDNHPSFLPAPWTPLEHINSHLFLWERGVSLDCTKKHPVVNPIKTMLKHPLSKLDDTSDWFSEFSVYPNNLKHLLKTGCWAPAPDFLAQKVREMQPSSKWCWCCWAGDHTLRSSNPGQAFILQIRQGKPKAWSDWAQGTEWVKEVSIPVPLSCLTVQGASHHRTAHKNLMKGIQRMSLSINKDPWCLILI